MAFSTKLNRKGDMVSVPNPLQCREQMNRGPTNQHGKGRCGHAFLHPSSVHYENLSSQHLVHMIKGLLQINHENNALLVSLIRTLSRNLLVLHKSLFLEWTGYERKNRFATD